MSDKAYEEFLALPVGAFFASADEDNWNTMPDAFVKVDEGIFRRTYDSVTWLAEVDIQGKTIDYEGTPIQVAKGWSALKILDEIPDSLGYITEEEAEERREHDRKRLADYIEEYGEYPEQGFW